MGIMLCIELSDPGHPRLIVGHSTDPSNIQEVEVVEEAAAAAAEAPIE